MVKCEECDTWQHIICYYPNELVPAVHFCEECGSKYHDAKRAAKRQRVDDKAASPNHDGTGRSVAETVLPQWYEVSPDLGSSALPNVVSTIGEREASSDDEPIILKSTKKIQNDDSTPLKETIKTEPDATATAGARQYILSGAAKSTATPIDLTDDTKDATKVKIEPRDAYLMEDATTFLSKFVSPVASPATSLTIVPATNHLRTPEPPPLTRSPLGARVASQLVNNATTFIFLDSQSRELRRRTFEDLGGRLNVGTLFGQAVRAGLIGKSDSDAILSVTIRGISESFMILKDDKPDFARLMQSIEAAGLCKVEIRLD